MNFYWKDITKQGVKIERCIMHAIALKFASNKLRIQSAHNKDSCSSQYELNGNMHCNCSTKCFRLGGQHISRVLYVQRAGDQHQAANRTKWFCTSSIVSTDLESKNTNNDRKQSPLIYEWAIKVLFEVKSDALLTVERCYLVLC